MYASRRGWPLVMVTVSEHLLNQQPHGVMG